MDVVVREEKQRFHAQPTERSTRNTASRRVVRARDLDKAVLRNYIFGEKKPLLSPPTITIEQQRRGERQSGDDAHP